MRFQRSVTTTAVMAAVLAAFSLLQSAASAQTTATGSAPPGLDGKDTFQQYCAVCHGLQGKGDGPAASALKSRPSDLATLAKRNGTFPAAHVTNVLKGMDPVVAHGSTAMMTWGAVFLADVNGDRSKADARINAVVRFIESLQVK